MMNELIKNNTVGNTVYNLLLVLTTYENPCGFMGFDLVSFRIHEIYIHRYIITKFI